MSVEFCEIHACPNLDFKLILVQSHASSQSNNPKMPPMAFNGIVTKAGVMNKTVTVTVSRQIIHKLTGKVRPYRTLNLKPDPRVQQIERSKKYLVHDEFNRPWPASLFFCFKFKAIVKKQCSDNMTSSSFAIVHQYRRRNDSN